MGVYVDDEDEGIDVVAETADAIRKGTVSVFLDYPVE